MSDERSGRDRLRELFGLRADTPAPKGAAAGAVLVETVETDGHRPAASLTALKLDDWGLRRGRDLAELPRFHSQDVPAEACADFHACAFEPVLETAETCIDPKRLEFVKALLETPECRALRTATVLDDLASEIAAAAFAEQYIALAARKPPPPPPLGRAPKEDPELEEARKEAEITRAVARAVTEASEEVGALRDAEAACGMGPAAEGDRADPARVARFFERIRRNPHLRSIFERAGRLLRLAQSKQHQKTNHGQDDVVGVTASDELDLVLAEELAVLVDDDLEWEALPRYLDAQLMALECKGVEPVGLGPVVFVTDSSGSMRGDKDHAAKALALSMAWIARRQKRWCVLISYSGDTGERLLTLPPGRVDDEALLNWLEDFIGGGSNLDVPLRELPGYWQKIQPPAGKTDIIFVTDAVLQAPAGIVSIFNTWRASVQARVISLVIDGAPGDMAKVSDEVYRVSAVDAAEEGVGRALSI